jgi:hypothetical protein
MGRPSSIRSCATHAIRTAPHRGGVASLGYPLGYTLPCGGELPASPLHHDGTPPSPSCNPHAHIMHISCCALRRETFHQWNFACSFGQDGPRAAHLASKCSTGKCGQIHLKYGILSQVRHLVQSKCGKNVANPTQLFRVRILPARAQRAELRGGALRHSAAVQSSSRACASAARSAPAFMAAMVSPAF